jgi:steroid 5-alpha reductase family enzyme
MMMQWAAAFATSTPALATLLVMAMLAFATWIVATAKRDVSVVDVAWGMFFLLGAGVYAYALGAERPRTAWLLLLVALWSLRLSGYIAWRNHGQPEDRRYQQIRARNQPHFAFKSLYLVFGLQAAIAWIVSAPLLAALGSARALGWLDMLGIALWSFGWLFETIADAQLARFRKARAMQPAGSSAPRILDTGLWRYSRHPNYFGECCLWWGFYLIATSAGAWWTIFSPLVMTFLLLRISGVALLDKSMQEKHPAYRDYIARTNAFFPGLPRRRPTDDAAPR